MDIYQPDRRRKGRARERYAERQQRKMAVPTSTALPDEKPITTRAPQEPRRTTALVGRAHVLLRDLVWHTRNNHLILYGIVVAAVAAMLLWLGSFVIGGRIFPNVWALGVNLGGMTVDEASTALQDQWVNGSSISLYDQDRVGQATPYDMGISLDARATAEATAAS
ncbi:MAG: hypothetical protein ABI835_16710, partial [Chloroflexota bacterium]